jgi:hypothetical protein
MIGIGCFAFPATRSLKHGEPGITYVNLFGESDCEDSEAKEAEGVVTLKILCFDKGVRRPYEFCGNGAGFEGTWGESVAFSRSAGDPTRTGVQGISWGVEAGGEGKDNGRVSSGLAEVGWEGKDEGQYSMVLTKKAG